MINIDMPDSQDPTFLDALKKKVQEMSDTIENLSFSFWKKTGSGTNSIQSPRIQSTDFVSGASGSGWAIDGNGNAEFNSGNFRGDLTGASGTFTGTVTATTGAIGGWDINSTSISKSVIVLDSANDKITVGGTDVILDSSGITAVAGTIGGTTITPTTLYGGIIQTSATVGAGSNGVIMDSAGLRGYDAVLGNTFNLPTDGSAPTFSSGKITETAFEVSTNAVIRTSVTTGDGSASSAGVLINNTGFYGLVANQIPATANVRILNTGTAYFGNATNYMSWDGTYLKLKGSFDVGTGGLINNAVYTVANLPIAPTSVGFEVPSAYE